MKNFIKHTSGKAWLALIFLLAFTSEVAFSQTPDQFSFQTVVVSSGNIVSSTNVSVRISILQGSLFGVPVFVEVQDVLTDINGLASIQVGSGINISGSIDSIDWTNGPYFLKTEIDPLGGSNYSLIETLEFSSVPFAFHAKVADSLTTGPGDFNHYVGELFGGGIVIDVWKENGVEHGLIASISDLADSATWRKPSGGWNSSSWPASFCDDLYDGENNTNEVIIDGELPGSAFSLCSDYTGGGFNDWYLPAAYELLALYKAGPIVNQVLSPANRIKFIRDVSGAPNNVAIGYWSSTRDVSDYVYYLSTQNQFVALKTRLVNPSTINYVRAVRRF